MRMGERIKAERMARDNMSRTKLAELSGVKYPTLAGIENGDQGSSTQLHAIAEALGVNPRWLETGAGPKFAASSSQPARLDPEIVAASFKLLRGAFARGGKQYDPERDPDLFVETYAYLADKEDFSSPDVLIDFGRYLAERQRSSEANDGEREAGAAGEHDRGAGQRRRGRKA